ncbi:MAG: heavy-metal-associated domain-containing protein [Deltaproteobacteria bacterium]|jgi:copper ion binding protein|nr:heavy-metal-associated domain-containing protein [Deltaproteobacteria bacterium]
MTKTIRIDGMSCGHCKAAVEKALRALPGVAGVTVDLTAKEARVSLDEPVPDERLAAAVADAGFEVVGLR